MKTSWQSGDAESLGNVPRTENQVLTPSEERAILREMADCKRKLSEALAKIRRPDAVPAQAAGALALQFATIQAAAGDGPAGARLGAIVRRYHELRGKLALANMRLVAHVAKRFRERGIAYSDLIQEGFCGLLEAIDRFDLSHETKLATYATWWIRQSMQRAVAAGAYPVRLSPRHLRQLSQNQEGFAKGAEGPRPKGPAGASAEMIHRIHTATRPTVPLDATLDQRSRSRLVPAPSDPPGEHADRADREATIGRLLQVLRPREQEILALRFGLRGTDRLSLSQVGKVLEVSKERVRQIQDRALEKLREAASEHGLEDVLILEA